MKHFISAFVIDTEYAIKYLDTQKTLSDKLQLEKLNKLLRKIHTIGYTKDTI